MRAVLLAAAFAAAGCAAGAETAAGPRLSAEPGSFDFGSVLAEKTLQKEIALRNLGGRELVIEKISTTCDCTVVGGYANRLAPGASTSLRIELRTPATPGRTEQAVTIDTNEAERPRVELTVSATVVAARKP